MSDWGDRQWARPTVTKETKEFQHLIFFTEGSVHRVSQLITWVSLSSKNRELYHVNRPFTPIIHSEELEEYRIFKIPF